MRNKRFLLVSKSPNQHILAVIFDRVNERNKGSLMVSKSPLQYAFKEDYEVYRE